MFMNKFRNIIPVILISGFMILNCDPVNFDIRETSNLAELTAEKETYSIGENVSLTLFNFSSETIFVLFETHPITLQKKVFNKWVSLDDDLPSITNWSYYRIEQGKSLNLHLFYETIEKIEKDRNGFYRVGITFFTKGDFDNGIFVTSKNFQFEK